MHSLIQLLEAIYGGFVGYLLEVSICFHVGYVIIGLLVLFVFVVGYL